MNKTIIIGNLTRDPELRKVNVQGQETSVARLDVAVNDRLSRDKTITTYFECNVWRNLADTCTQYLHKGSKVMVEGRISANPYTDREGNAKASLVINVNTIEFLDSRNNNNNTATAAPVAQNAPAQQPNYDAPVATNAGFTVVESDELPF